MKLYDSIGPNPHIVRMFMAEKGIDMPKQTVDLRKGENREAEHLKRNPSDPVALQFTIQALLTNQRNDNVGPLAERLGRAAAETGDLGALQYTIQAFLTIGDLDAAERALTPFENAGAGNPQVAQFAVAVRQHIQSERAKAQPTGPPLPPAGQEGQKGGGN